VKPLRVEKARPLRERRISRHPSLCTPRALDTAEFDRLSSLTKDLDSSCDY
jgi:hypothetical protein